MGNTIKKDTSVTPEEAQALKVRSRWWATMVYPESASENWQDLLAQDGYCCAVSPIHDADTNKDGTTKKPHYHVLFKYKNAITRSSFQSTVVPLIRSVGAERIMEPSGYCRYLAHLDSPDKAQYDAQDIVSIGGFDIAHMLVKPEPKENLLMDLFAIIDDMLILKYDALVRYCREERPDLFGLAISKSYAINQYMKSASHNAVFLQKQKERITADSMNEGWRRLEAGDKTPFDEVEEEANVSRETLTTEQQILKFPLDTE